MPYACVYPLVIHNAILYKNRITYPHPENSIYGRLCSMLGMVEVYTENTIVCKLHILCIGVGWMKEGMGCPTKHENK